MDVGPPVGAGGAQDDVSAAKAAKLTDFGPKPPAGIELAASSVFAPKYI